MSQNELLELVEKGNVTVKKQLVTPSAAGKEDSESLQPSFNVVTEEQYRKVADRLLQADLELIDAQARLETARLPGGTTSAEKLRELETAVEEAKRKRISYCAVPRPGARSHPGQQHRRCPGVHAEQDLAYLKRLQESVKLKLAQLEFEIGQEAYRISVQDKAAVPKVPANNNRLKYMAVTPVGRLLPGPRAVPGPGDRVVAGLRHERDVRYDSSGVIANVPHREARSGARRSGPMELPRQGRMERFAVLLSDPERAADRRGADRSTWLARDGADIVTATLTVYRPAAAYRCWPTT